MCEKDSITTDIMSSIKEYTMTELSPVWLYVRCQYNFSIEQTLQEIQNFVESEKVSISDVCVSEKFVSHVVWRHLNLTWFCTSKSLSADLTELLEVSDIASSVSRIKGPYHKQCDAYHTLMENTFGSVVESDVLALCDDINKSHYILLRHKMLLDEKHIARTLLANRLTR